MIDFTVALKNGFVNFFFFGEMGSHINSIVVPSIVGLITWSTPFIKDNTMNGEKNINVRAPTIVKNGYKPIPADTPK